MPLNQTELDEIKTAIESGAYSDNALLSPLAGLGLNFRSKADEDAFKLTVEGDAIRRREPEIHKLYETEIEAISGIKKNAGEMGTAYLKRATEATKTELETLRTKEGGAGLTAKQTARLAELEELAEKNETTLTAKETEYKTKLTEYVVGADVRTALAKVEGRLVKTLTGEAREDVVSARLAKFRKDYTPEMDGEGDDAVVVWKKGDKYENDAKGKRKTTEALLTEVFGAYVEAAKQQPGAGTGPNGKKPAEGGAAVTADSYTPGEGVDTKDKLVADLKAKGFMKGSKEFTELFTKHGKDLKLK